MKKFTILSVNMQPDYLTLSDFMITYPDCYSSMDSCSRRIWRAHA